MSRLQKKCFVASVAMHALLVAVVFFGAAFLAPKELTQPMRKLSMIPNKIVDSLVPSGGGAPEVTDTHPVLPPPAEAVAPTPPPPVPVEPPKPVVVPPPPPPEPVVTRPPVEQKREPKPTDRVVPKKMPTKEAKSKSPPVEPTPKTTAKAKEEKSLPKVDTSSKKLVSRNAKEVEARAEAERKALQDAADKAAKRRADQVAAAAGAVSDLKANLSGGMKIETIGTGGEAFANYGEVVVNIYRNAWLIPQDVNDDSVVVQVSVTIARDGRVIRARIIGPSSNSTVNKSVRRTLDDVKFVAPFPEGAKDAERTFNIDFNLKAKRLTG